MNLHQIRNFRSACIPIFLILLGMVVGACDLTSKSKNETSGQQTGNVGSGFFLWPFDSLGTLGPAWQDEGGQAIRVAESGPLFSDTSLLHPGPTLLSVGDTVWVEGFVFEKRIQKGDITLMLPVFKVGCPQGEGYLPYSALVLDEWETPIGRMSLQARLPETQPWTELQYTIRLWDPAGKEKARCSFRCESGEFTAEGNTIEYIHEPRFQSFHAVKSLPGVQSVAFLTLSVGACLYVNSRIGIFWDGQKLFAGPPAQEMENAGVSYWSNREIFPHEAGGKPGGLVFGYSNWEGIDAGIEDSTVTLATDTLAVFYPFRPRIGFGKPDTLYRASYRNPEAERYEKE